MARIFISYKRRDKDIVFPLKDRIEAALGEPCWIDLDGIESDAQFVSVIIRAINEAEVFLFMYSRHHAEIKDFDKDWTVREINLAEKRNKRIVFVNIDKTSLSDYFELMFGMKQQIDATSKESFDRLLSDMRKWLGIKEDAEKPNSPQTHNTKISRTIEPIVSSTDKSLKAATSCEAFWNAFILYAKNNHPEFVREFSLRKARNESFYDIAIGKGNCYLSLNVQSSKNTIDIGLYIPNDKEYYEQLKSHAKEISKLLGGDVKWHDAGKASRVMVVKQLNTVDVSNWPIAFGWYIQMAPLLKQCTKSSILSAVMEGAVATVLSSPVFMMGKFVKSKLEELSTKKS